MDYHIIKISRNKKQYLDLLLLGDEQETMIDRYLERGDLFVSVSYTHLTLPTKRIV